jgi:hypothetical protein
MLRADRRERRLDHSQLEANAYQARAYKNEYKQRAILVSLEAGGVD